MPITRILRRVRLRGVVIARFPWQFTLRQDQSTATVVITVDGGDVA